MSKSRENKAVALKYNMDEDMAPVVIASGYGTIAEKIIDVAEQKGIPVFKDDSAASLMCMLEVGSNIPVELYEIVAAIYRQLLETSAQIKNKQKPAETNNNRISSKLNLVSQRKRTNSVPEDT
ncbi:EscU/YscU/HrcU family type III secretion system export apparatus switch protein [Hydrogenoanaerobacterium sp.]|uniref:EscU/YscU/HrcU family type III secretion system export apparatus switch protein n=1 Tax=Hydrogenoanaerobacterium sp. TaxID=2953763 RepID=UPI0028A2C41F|nr:EscU/YscU/HrcU family type III secretion system export apparatus switch protein [Hydrogenoanaerobacterium sp.]